MREHFSSRSYFWGKDNVCNQIAVPRVSGCSFCIEAPQLSSADISKASNFVESSLFLKDTFYQLVLHTKSQELFSFFKTNLL